MWSSMSALTDVRGMSRGSELSHLLALEPALAAFAARVCWLMFNFCNATPQTLVLLWSQLPLKVKWCWQG